MTHSISSITETYSNRFKVDHPYFGDKVTPENLCLVIAIPSYKEPDILTTLLSLARCQPPSGTVEVIIGINAPEDSSEKIQATNEQTAKQIETWKKQAPEHMKVLVIRKEDIPKKIAGAGHARKIVMDEALHRWAASGKDGPIVCLDADCIVSENYLTEIENAYMNPEVRLAHLHFEHPYESELDETLRYGIVNYELHLRCYIRGLKSAGYPYAIHTVGSCMAVRASVYAKGGGMNSRKAGEDFHFLHKLVPQGGWQAINSATVYPSCRVSDRVPFGTGKAQSDFKKALLKGTYSTDIYKVISTLFEVLPQWYHQEIRLETFPDPLRDFLREQQIVEKIEAMRCHSKTANAFYSRLWQWMDGLKVLKMIHHLRDHGFHNIGVEEAARSLIAQLGIQPENNAQGLLQQLRQVDRQETLI